MYAIQKVIKKDRLSKQKIELVKQQLELDYWLSQALEAGCFSLECSG
jgi:hypothetical protein